MVFKNVFLELKMPLSAPYCRFVARFFDCVGQTKLANRHDYESYFKRHLHRKNQ